MDYKAVIDAFMEHRAALAWAFGGVAFTYASLGAAGYVFTNKMLQEGHTREDIESSFRARLPFGLRYPSTLGREAAYWMHNRQLKCADRMERHL